MEKVAKVVGMVVLFFVLTWGLSFLGALALLVGWNMSVQHWTGVTVTYWEMFGACIFVGAVRLSLGLALKHPK